MQTARVRFLRGTSLGGGRDAAPGDVVEIDARLLPGYLAQARVTVVQEPDNRTEKPARKGKFNA